MLMAVFPLNTHFCSMVFAAFSSLLCLMMRSFCLSIQLHSQLQPWLSTTTMVTLIDISAAFVCCLFFRTVQLGSPNLTEMFHHES